MRPSDIIIDNNSEDFIERVMRENLWSKEYTLRVIEEYKKFIYLGTFQSVSPSYQIDQVWHTHLLFTKDYKKMCDEVIGFYFHHNPFNKDDKAEQASKPITQDPYFLTKKLYFQKFGYQPPSDIWTDWKKSNYTYIDLNQHWVIPVGDWGQLIKLLRKKNH